MHDNLLHGEHNATTVVYPHWSGSAEAVTDVSRGFSRRLLVEGEVHILEQLMYLNTADGKPLFTKADWNEAMLLLHHNNIGVPNIEEFLDWYDDVLAERLQNLPPYETQPRTRMASTMRPTPTRKAALR